MIALDFSKQQGFDSNTKSIQTSNFTGSLEEQLTIFFIIEEAKETVLHFSQGTANMFHFFYFFLSYKNDSI